MATVHTPAVILLAGPSGSGKTTTAARIARTPGWAHLSEDDFWVELKAGRPDGERRTGAEQEIVQPRVIERLDGLRAAGKRVVLEFILYEDPPVPLLRYREALDARSVPHEVRILSPRVEEILRRIRTRGRPRDVDGPELRASVENQVAVLSSPHIERGWLLDTTGLGVEETFERHVRHLLA